LSLGVYLKGAVGVLGPHGVDIVVIVAREKGGVHHDPGVGTQCPERRSVIIDDELIPACSILDVLSLEPGAYGLQSICRKARDAL